MREWPSARFSTRPMVMVGTGRVGLGGVGAFAPDEGLGLRLAAGAGAAVKVAAGFLGEEGVRTAGPGRWLSGHWHSGSSHSPVPSASWGQGSSRGRTSSAMTSDTKSRGRQSRSRSICVLLPALWAGRWSRPKRRVSVVLIDDGRRSASSAGVSGRRSGAAAASGTPVPLGWELNVVLDEEAVGGAVGAADFGGDATNGPAGGVEGGGALACGVAVGEADSELRVVLLR